MFWLENDGCYYDRYKFPPYFPITKTDLKKGLNGIYPDRRFKIQAISPKSVKIAPSAFFSFILFLIQFTFSEIGLPACSSCENIGTLSCFGLSVHI